jgi:Stealth protein CR2, conserved region 2/Stealth protein CR1, conserved region 1/Stealth protein CR4, conserved region 4
MRTLLRRSLTLVRDEGRRQLRTRFERLARPVLPPPYRWVRWRRVAVAARVDDRLRLGEHKARTAALLTSRLAAADVGYWWVPQPHGEGRRLAVRASDRAGVLALLAALPGPSWYLDVVEPSGRRQRQVLPAARAGQQLGEAAGLVVWEQAVASPDSSFAAGPDQGVELHFWAAADGELTSLVSTLGVTRLQWDQVPPSGQQPHVLSPGHASTVRFPVDVVYTWVDGSDEAWLAAKAGAAGAADERAFTERAHDVSRYADHDELRFSLRSLEQFAPWVNHVWIVTAGQQPAWLDPGHPWVSVVSHADIWPDADGLPTFNSHAIEACLHRIPGLAEHFLYLNDDMILGRPVAAEQFFHGNGIGQLFLSRALVDFAPSATGEIASSTAAKNARRLLSLRYGATFTQKFFHTAAALTVSGLAELEGQYPDVFTETRRAVFRTVHDVAPAGSFYLNWGYLTGRLVPGRLRYTYIDPAAPDAAARLAALARHRSFDTFCINDGARDQTLDERRRTDAVIRSFLAGYLPVVGSFELQREPVLRP